MKLLHIYSGNLYGGVERMLGTLARVQPVVPELKHEFALCFEGKLADELRQSEAKMHLLGGVRVRYPWTLWLARRELQKVLANSQPDWVMCHSNWPYALFSRVLAKTPVKTAVLMHDRPAGTWLDNWAKLRQPTLLICNSQYTAEHVATWWPEVKRSVYYCPGHLVNHDSNRRHAKREELGVQRDQVVFFQASRLERWKGLHIYLQALQYLKPYPGWQAWLAGAPQKPGEAAYLQELEAIVQQHGLQDRVRFLGWRSDAVELMHAADVFCQPNVGPEPFGLVFTEALWAGTPVVSTAIGGALEIVTPECGILVPPNNPEAVGQALRKLLLDPETRQRLGLAGPAQAKALVDPETQLRKLYHLLQEASA